MCRKCGSPDISPDQLRNRNYLCRGCRWIAQSQWRKDNPERFAVSIRKARSRWTEKNRPRKQEIDRAYSRTVSGTACALRKNHGLTHEKSVEWARVLSDEASRCAICGIPVYLIRKYNQDGPWPRFLGTRRAGWRLQLDHVIPGDNDGPLRALCSGCNAKRADAVFTDESVLTWIRSQWQFILPLRFLWWLNKIPGVGGRLHRTTRLEQKHKKWQGRSRP